MKIIRKRLLSVLLCTLLLISILPVSVSAADVAYSYDCATLYSDGTLEITADVSNLAPIPWEKERSLITKIIFTVETQMTSSRMFTDCKNLTEVILPSTLTEIPARCFNACTSLTSIVIPDSVTTIGERAFGDCSALENVTFGENSSLQTIGINAFSGCKKLLSMELPEGVTSIGNYAFSTCIAMTSVTIPDSVTSIGDRAFTDCYALENVIFGENSNLQSINVLAFNQCDSLVSIKLPRSITSIGNHIFNSCDSLTDVYFEGTEVEWSKISLGTSVIPSGVTLHTVPTDILITGGTLGTDYTYENGVLDILTAGAYELKNSDPTTATTDAVRVSVASGEVSITLGGVNIKPADKSAFDITGNCETTVILKDGTENTLDNTTDTANAFAALHNGEKVLTITCESSGDTAHECTADCGKLTAGSIWAAAIGGGDRELGSNITVSGGIIIAETERGAAIGGGNYSSGTDITVTGGEVTATGIWGAGIGAGQFGNGSNITVSGGTVTATSTSEGAGIGGGTSGNGSNITVSGGTVTATARSGAGIGGGQGGNGGNITVSGGTVTATSTSEGAGIGGGSAGNGSNITVSGGTVTATSGYGIGIGGGSALNIKIAPTDNTEITLNTGKNAAEAEDLTFSFAEEVDITALVSGNAYFYSRVQLPSDTVSAFLGGSLRIDTSTAEKASLRLGYVIDASLPEGAEIISWSWKYGFSENQLNYTAKGEKFTEMSVGKVSNLVLTDIPAAYYKLSYYAQLTVVYELDGKEYISVDEVKSRNIYDVATAVANDPTESESARAYAQSLLDAVDAV